MFAEEPTPEQQEHIEQYTRKLTDSLVEVALEAIRGRRPGRLYWVQGKLGFAVNRRVIRDSKYVGFGEQADGPVDHSLPVLVAKSENGRTIALLANYACHCTTLGGDFNQICGDWAGYAQDYLEQDHPGAVAMISIGCGADANPTPRGKLDMCKQQGRALADEVKRLLNEELIPVPSRIICKFDEIELPLGEIPTRDQWQSMALQKDAAGRRARHFLEMLDQGQSIPKSVTYPIAAWTFGDDLAMVFLGGEVVVDYAIRMKDEFDAKRLWITAYANDTPCYIASKRILREGGYEADSSMVYYGLPTRLAPDTEDLIIDTVQRLLPPQFYSAQKQEEYPAPRSPEESLRSISVRPGMKVELVAAEPLIVDPVAFDWGPDGRLWVVEMRDYPNGIDNRGKPGGRIKTLFDSDDDGQFDRSTIFLDDLPYPTGVMVWRKGILISGAPDLLYAEDRDGDGRADHLEKLYSGFGEGNQQHRVNGLRWGLDNWVHLGNGDSNGMVKSHRTGKIVNVSGRDLRIRPDEGLLDPTSGNTQFGRDRDDWGNWFGGNNSNPMWHYVLDDFYLRRNPHVASPAVRKHVSVQPGASPVFPMSKTMARFNDYNMANRFTSACSPIIYRDDLLGAEFVGNSFVCEPVHNLVHREIVEADGVTFTSRRADDEKATEFFASRDNWCRPSMVRVGPDGAIWIADMYRSVIEHPTWIPEESLRRLDVRAGDDRGRIYRIYPMGKAPRRFARLDTLDNAGLVKELTSPNGWRRDMAHQMLLWRDARDEIDALVQTALRGATPQSRVHALCVLDGLHAISSEVLLATAGDAHPGVRRHAVRLAEPLLNESAELADTLKKLASDLDPHVRLQVAYSLGAWSEPKSGAVLAKIALAHQEDEYILAAVMSSVNRGNLAAMLDVVLAEEAPPVNLVKRLLAPASALGEEEIVNRVLTLMAVRGPSPVTAAQMETIAEVLETLDRRTTSLSKLGDEPTRRRLASIFDTARVAALDVNAQLAERGAAVRLLGSGLGEASDAVQALGELLVPQNPAELQFAAVKALTKIASRETPTVLIRHWRSYSPLVRSGVLDALLSRVEWSMQLVAAIEQGAVPASQIEARRRQQLLDSKDRKLREASEKLFGAAKHSERALVVEQFQHVLRAQGEVTRGKEVFRKRCATCHRLEDDGYSVGPDLTALTNKSPEALLIAILDPNRAVEDKFLDYLAITSDGRQFTGVLQDETGTSFTLQGPDAKQQTILRKDLEMLAATGKSLMPEGIENDVSAAELADVIAYVRSVGPPLKQFSGNKPETVRVSINGRLQCLATNCRIYGPTLVFEDRYGNLGYWQSEADRAAWTIDVPRAARYRVTLDYACQDDAAGDTFVLEVAGQTLGGRVERSGDWDNYRSMSIGEVELSEGQFELQVRSGGPIRHALMDLREVRLTPVE
jgi:putative membrane-bound dehydrogenase-like protein